MESKSIPPSGCAWWTLGDETSNPPEDELFLRKLYDAGFSTYVGPIGLIGARSEIRSVVVIHQGRGRRWNITLREAEVDRYIENWTKLPFRVEGAIAWLRGESLEKVRLLLEITTDPQ